MKLTNEQIEQILEGAPEGATHYGAYAEQYRYLKELSAYIRGEWQTDYDLFVVDTHDLNALREILTLRQRVEELEAQLGKTNNKCVVYDLEPAQYERAIRDHLIKLGWTPPKEKDNE